MKFNKTEKWILDESLKEFKAKWLKEVADLKKEDKRSLFHPRYIEDTFKYLNEKVESFTLKKALKDEKSK